MLQKEGRELDEVVKASVEEGCPAVCHFVVQIHLILIFLQEEGN